MLSSLIGGLYSTVCPIFPLLLLVAPSIASLALWGEKVKALVKSWMLSLFARGQKSVLSNFLGAGHALDDVPRLIRLWVIGMHVSCVAGFKREDFHTTLQTHQHKELHAKGEDSLRQVNKISRVLDRVLRLEPW